MTTYRKVKAHTLIKKHLPYCRNCHKWHLLQNSKYSYTPVCEDGINESNPDIFQHFGAGCPNFIENKSKEDKPWRKPYHQDGRQVVL